MSSELKTPADVIARAKAAGLMPVQLSNTNEWRATCPRCLNGSALKIIGTPEPDALAPATLWCVKCRRLELHDIPAPAASESAPAAPRREWGEPPTLDPVALYGPIGDYVRTIAPDTEASPAGILGATITTIGAMLGRSRYCMIEGLPHHARFFTPLVGPSATGRKGTAITQGVTRVITAVDSTFFERTVSGLSSAEGLISCVRDPIPEGEGPNGKGDPGVLDKRLLVKQGEFAGVLKMLEREGNALSPRLREAWDGDSLQVITRSAPLVATAPHICLIAAITPSEMSKSLKAVEVMNGLANRLMPFWCEREQFLPFGGSDNGLEVRLALRELQRAVERAPQGEVTWTADGREWWAARYADLSTPQAGGTLGTLLARGAPMVQRLALLFAVLDGVRERSAAHCEAAHAVWRYVEGTWRTLYGRSDTLSDRARRLLIALNTAGPLGVPKSECRHKLGSGNISADDITAALAELRETGLARPHRQAGKGRPAETWVATRHLSEDGQNGRNGQEAPELGADPTITTISTIPPHTTGAPIDHGPPLDLIANDAPVTDEAESWGVLDDAA